MADQPRTARTTTTDRKDAMPTKTDAAPDTAEATVAKGGRRKKLRTIWLAEEVGSTDTAVAELKEIVGHVFESPKPTGRQACCGTSPGRAACR